MICSNCGYRHSSGRSRCDACGYKLGKIPQSKGRNTISKVLAIVFGLVGLIVIFVIAFQELTSSYCEIDVERQPDFTHYVPQISNEFLLVNQINRDNRLTTFQTADFIYYWV